MRTDLQELLQQRQICHPTRIVAVEVSHRQLRITVEGKQWWRDHAGQQDGQIVFLFEGIEEGLLQASTLLDMKDDEALEVFEVSRLSDNGWAPPRHILKTYCLEPLPCPLKLYAIVEDYLFEVGAPRSSRDYLNIPNGSIAHFCQIASTRLFLLADAPPNIHELILAELRRQNVSHSVIASDGHPKEALFVRIGDSSFVCDRATAET